MTILRKVVWVGLYAAIGAAGCSGQSGPMGDGGSTVADGATGSSDGGSTVADGATGSSDGGSTVADGATGSGDGGSGPGDGGLALQAPAGLSASDGLYADRVELTWSPVAGATAYDVLRDGALLAGGVTTTQYSDSGATASGAPGAPASLQASDATEPSGVRLTWTAPTLTAGPMHQYTVRARSGSTQGPPSTAETGFRGASPVQSYQFSVDGTTWLPAGTGSPFVDLSAPAATLTSGMAVASDGVSSKHVLLDVVGAGASAGASRTYSVRAVNAAGPGPASNGDPGSRGVGALTFQWERSSDDSPQGLLPLTGATTRAYADTTAPVNGSGRTYRCVVSAEGAGSMPTLYDRGYRHALPSTTPRPEIMTTDGFVTRIDANADTLFVLGAFERVGLWTGGLVAIDSNTGDLTFESPELAVDGIVHTSVSDGAGGLFVGGTFKSIRGVQQRHLAHLLADGTLDPTFKPDVDDWVDSLALSGGQLYVGGLFYSVNGKPHRGLAALDPATGTPSSWSPVLDRRPTALAVDGGVVYVAGAFTSVNGQPRTHLAAFDATTGALTSWNPGPDGEVTALVAGKGRLYVGGSYQKIDGAARSSLASFDSVTGKLEMWDPLVTGKVGALALDADVLYVGGLFTQVGFRTVTNLVAVQLADGAATAWSPKVEGAIQTMLLDGTTLYIGGGITAVDGQKRSRIAAFDLQSETLTAWTPPRDPSEDPSPRILTLGRTAAALYVGGTFMRYVQHPRVGVTAFNAPSGHVTNWNPTFAVGEAYDLAVGTDVVYVGGSFSTVAGQARHGLVALDAKTGAVSTWVPPLPVGSLVGRVRHVGGRLYIDGRFPRGGALPPDRFAAIDLGSNQLIPFDAAGIDGSIYSVAVVGDTVYVAGEFTTVAGQERNGLAAFSESSGKLTSWNPQADSALSSAVLAHGGKLYVGGGFKMVAGELRNGLAVFDLATGALLPWDAKITGTATVETMAVSGDTLFIGGDVTDLGGSPRSSLGALDLETGAAKSWAPSIRGLVYAIATIGNGVYVGGLLDEVAGRTRPFFAGFTP